MPKEPSNSQHFLLRLPADLQFLNVIAQFANALFSEIFKDNDDSGLVYSCELIVSEACTNVMRHAYAEAEEPGLLELNIWPKTDRLVFQIIDFGLGFDPEEVSEPALEQGPEGGMGLFIIRQCVDVFEYRRKPGHNLLHLEKHFDSGCRSDLSA